jgi:mannose-1-phosphate guanylyltransferase
LNKEVIDISLEVIPRYLGRMRCYHNAGYHRDIGTPESLRLANLEWK